MCDLQPVPLDDIGIGIATANQILMARAEGKPVVAIAAIHQLNPIVFTTLKRSGIRHPRDFAGKVIRVSRANLPLLQALTKRFGVEPDAYSTIGIHNTSEVYRKLSRGEIDVMTGFQFWTPNKMKKDGQEAFYIYPDDYGTHFYRDCIFTTERSIDKHPGIVEGFLRATLRDGWPAAFEDPDRAGAMTAHYRENADTAFEAQFLTAMIPLIVPGILPIGWMESKKWDEMSEGLVFTELLPASFDPATAYTMRFLQSIYPDTEVQSQ